MTGPNPLYRLFWRWHFFAALLVIPFVLWQGITGSLYLWSGQWMDFAHPELRFVTPAVVAAPISQRLNAVLAAHPAAHIAEIQIPQQADRSTVVLIQDDDGLVSPVFVDHAGAVLGTLGAASWLPGITRSLHGGWPLGAPGSWLLELGDCWAIVMIATGVYLWWPRGASGPRGLLWLRALWPRLRQGQRVFWRDLHACVAVWFSLFILAFLITALPWTAFWGGQVLTPIQQRLDQQNPGGFSPGGATAQAVRAALPALDRLIAQARQSGVVGTLQIRLGPTPGSDWWIHNVNSPPGFDRYITGHTTTGTIKVDVHDNDNPLMARLINAGVHLHQGDFGAINRWLNTAIAMAVIWMSVTGIVSWWLRRPNGGLSAPARSNAGVPRGVLASGAVLCVVLPLLGLSVAAIFVLDRCIDFTTRWRTVRA